MKTEQELFEALKRKYMRLFSTDDGKAVLEDLRQRCFKYTTTYGGSYQDALVNEGKRQSLLHIETMIDVEKEGE